MGSSAMLDLVVVVLIAAITFLLLSHLDAFEWLVSVVHHYERYDLDEVVVLFAILSIAFAAFAGRRWIEVSREQARRLEMERIKVILETAGAVSHEFNQPLQVIVSASELALEDASENSPMHKYLSDILNSAVRISELIIKLTHITDYRTKDYCEGQKILDLDSGSGQPAAATPPKQ
ncbi:histidine kinase dimerization/phospho-acceptor domain-containing protein [Desulfoferula mesophila]|uniref:histidine kinase dimerization/phospho-acceptor domain-containing protein n=1 Tax=Desulfoferula mesophila TaxID=3058419 RepID=UPI0030D0729E